MGQNINNSGQQKKLQYSMNYKNTLTDEVIFQVGEHYSKLIFYNYDKTIDSANQTKQDMTTKIINTEIMIPNQVLRNLSNTIHLLFEIKDGLFNTIQSQLSSGTAEAYMKLSSLINFQFFDTDQSVSLSKFQEDFKELAESLKLEIEFLKPKDEVKKNPP